MTDLDPSRPADVRLGVPCGERRWDGAAGTLALCTLWIAQPLYDLLGAVPDYFLVRGLGTSDVWLFGLLAFLGPPAFLVGLAELAGVAGPRLRHAAYRGLFAVLAAWGALLGLGLLRHLFPTFPWTGGSLLGTVLGAATAWWLLRPETRRAAATFQVLRILACLAPLAPVFFFLRPEIRSQIGPVPRALELSQEAVELPRESAGVTTPVVMIVLDELPLFTLLDPRGGIDVDLFPHLARFSRTAGWYRGAVTPHIFNQHALPALVAGRTAGLDDLPTARVYPDNLLALLGPSHRVISSEILTSFDPRRDLAPRGERLAALASDAALVLAHAALPGGAPGAGRLPRPALRMPAGGLESPAERFDDLLRRLDSAAGSPPADPAAARKPLLLFAHLLQPHHPWLLDEEGRFYDGGDEMLLSGIESPQIGAIHARWQDDWETVLDAYERHVLQARHADALVGRLLDRLRRHELFEHALVVVAADHGLHVAPGEPLRQRSDTNFESLASVPLLVKWPGQSEGFVDDARRSTLDVLPTILETLGMGASALDLPGTSLLGPPAPPETAAPPAEPGYREVRERWLERRLEAGPDGFGPWHAQLAGRPLRLGGVPTRDWVVDLEAVERLERPPPDLPPLRRLAGRLLPRRPEVLEELVSSGEPLPLGVGLDGVMVATTHSDGVEEGEEFLTFSVLLPADAMTPGEHEVVLYLLPFDGERVLEPLPIPRRARPILRIEEEANGPQLVREVVRSPSRRAPIRRLPGRLRAPETGAQAVALRFHGVHAAVEVFGRVPAELDVDEVAIFRDGRLLARARWVDDPDEVGRRYRFGGGFDRKHAPGQRVRAFRTTVPTGATVPIGATVATGDALRVVAYGPSTAWDVPLEIVDESPWRMTGPFRLDFDPRTPPAAYPNY